MQEYLQGKDLSELPELECWIGALKLLRCTERLTEAGQIGFVGLKVEIGWGMQSNYHCLHESDCPGPAGPASERGPDSGFSATCQ